MSVDNELLIEQHLAEQGLPGLEIKQILQELRMHDKRTIRESVFHSIATGTWNLDATIKEVKSAR